MDPDEHAAATSHIDQSFRQTIAQAIEAAAGTEHVPVTFDHFDHVAGPFFHGKRSTVQPGVELVPGYLSNYQAGRVANHVYFSALLEPAVLAAELAIALAGADEHGHVYLVEPMGPFEDDPNVTNKRFPGNVTRSYRSRHPVRVVSEFHDWERLDPSTVQAMVANLTRLREQGLDVIED